MSKKSSFEQGKIYPRGSGYEVFLDGQFVEIPKVEKVYKKLSFVEPKSSLPPRRKILCCLWNGIIVTLNITSGDGTTTRRICRLLNEKPFIDNYGGLQFGGIYIPGSTRAILRKLQLLNGDVLREITKIMNIDITDDERPLPIFFTKTKGKKSKKSDLVLISPSEEIKENLEILQFLDRYISTMMKELQNLVEGFGCTDSSDESSDDSSEESDDLRENIVSFKLRNIIITRPETRDLIRLPDANIKLISISFTGREGGFELSYEDGKIFMQFEKSAVYPLHGYLVRKKERIYIKGTPGTSMYLHYKLL